MSFNCTDIFISKRHLLQKDLTVSNSDTIKRNNNFSLYKVISIEDVDRPVSENNWSKKNEVLLRTVLNIF